MRPSLWIELQSKKTTYTFFTPNYAEQRESLRYYRGCWHLYLPRLLFILTHNVSICIDFTTTVAFFIPTNSIGHTSMHCLIFFTAANGAFSVPVWLILLSNQLRIISCSYTKPNPTCTDYKSLNYSFKNKSIII